MASLFELFGSLRKWQSDEKVRGFMDMCCMGDLEVAELSNFCIRRMKVQKSSVSFEVGSWREIRRNRT